jgi:hypothetical protein
VGILRIDPGVSSGRTSVDLLSYIARFREGEGRSPYEEDLTVMLGVFLPVETQA